jgi:hypothetical protein
MFTVWGLPGALSVMLNEAERPKIPVGVKVTLNVQVPFAAIVLGDTGQLLLSLKSPGLEPVSAETLLIVKLALPVLVRVIVCAALGDPSG